MPASISIAITNSIIREGLRRIFTDASFEVVESVSHLDELDLHSRPEDGRHILVVERELLQEDCVGSIETMQRNHPQTTVVVLTAAFDFDEMVALYMAGVYAYFPDNVPYLSLVAILQMVANGQKVAPPQVIDFLIALPPTVRHPAATPALEAFGFRERELRVLEHLALGQPNKAISREMAINEAAVKAAVKAILRKLGVENRTQAAVMARELINTPSAPLDRENMEGNVDPFPAHHPPPQNQSGHGSTSCAPDSEVHAAQSSEETRPSRARNSLLQDMMRKSSACLIYLPALQMALAS
ncbi:response regulator transcription factor [Novosphingobium guangzhouense]|uniref:response regulator transcription factor n=1 Tax=Novosphingobium guangzhouense TaxID=1850347 RepID=UPI000CCC9C34|nr:response regulator transcription factor [Novosphingobium guangzhouense]